MSWMRLQRNIISVSVEDYYIDGKRIASDAIDVADPAQRCLLDYSMLCNDSTNENGVEIGDPTETALINLGSRLKRGPSASFFPRRNSGW